MGRLSPKSRHLFRVCQTAVQVDLSFVRHVSVHQVAAAYSTAKHACGPVFLSRNHVEFMFGPFKLIVHGSEVDVVDAVASLVCKRAPIVAPLILNFPYFGDFYA